MRSEKLPPISRAPTNRSARATHSFAPYVFLATNDPKVWQDGRRQDVAPAILEAFGVEADTLDPAINGISLTKPDNRPSVPVTKDRRPRAVASGKQG